MSILEKTGNRTENWKTVKHFHGITEEAKARITQSLSGEEKLMTDEIELQLFWKGVRDYVVNRDDKEELKKDFAKRYDSLFPNLRRCIEKRPYKFRKLKDHNYVVEKLEQQIELYENLRNTEIDIVLETSDYLFIGEAKDESPFNSSREYVLVHQLIREYVMARILVDRLDLDKKVVPFVVGDNAENLKNYSQVKFMVNQGWLDKKNILSWKDIKKLTRNS